MHQDGSLADLTLLSASSVDAALPREPEEVQEKQEEQEVWESEKERKQVLVVVMDNTDMGGEKRGSLHDLPQSSTEESHHCSAGSGAEPSTEQSSGTELRPVITQGNLLTCSSLKKSSISLMI